MDAMWQPYCYLPRVLLECAGSKAHDKASARTAMSDLQDEAEAQWADATVQQCLDLCSNVDMVYKLLIQEIQPVLGPSSRFLSLQCLSSCPVACCACCAKALSYSAEMFLHTSLLT